MKGILIALLLAWAATAEAQSTYVQYRATNFVYRAPAAYVYSTNLVVGTNEVARVVNFQYGATVTGFTLTLQYGDDPTVFSFANSPQNVLNLPVLGPANVGVYITNATASGDSYILAQFENVNVAPSAIGLVQPAGKTATVALQTSTDLKTWSNVVLTNYGAGTGNKFFRIALTNSP